MLRNFITKKFNMAIFLFTTIQKKNNNKERKK